MKFFNFLKYGEANVSNLLACLCNTVNFIYFRIMNKLDDGTIS